MNELQAYELLKCNTETFAALQLLLDRQRKVCSEFAVMHAHQRENDIVNGKSFGFHIFETDISNAPLINEEFLNDK